MSKPIDWYAVRVKANREKTTAQSLRGREIDVCLPSYQVESATTRGVHLIQVPLFAGYIFARLDPKYRLPVLIVPGVVGIVGCGNNPEPVDPREMNAVLALVGSDLQVSPHSYLPVGQRIRLQTGPLRGVEGIVVDHKNGNRLVVSVSILQRSIAVDVERQWLLPLRKTA